MGGRARRHGPLEVELRGLHAPADPGQEEEPPAAFFNSQRAGSRWLHRRSGRLYRARSRLYRNEILQVNMRLKALAEIYTMHSFAPFSNRIFFAKMFANFSKIQQI